MKRHPEFRQRLLFHGPIILAAILAIVFASWSTPMAMAADDEEMADAPAKPKGKKKAGAKDAPAAEAEEPDLPPPASAMADPMIRSLIESNPTKPRDLVRIIRIFAQIRQPALAKPYAKRLAAAELSPAEMDGLIDEFGVGEFDELSRVPELAKTMGLLTEKLLNGSEAYRTDPARLRKLIDELGSPSTETRRAAAAELRRAHTAGAVALVSALADPERAAMYKPIATTLVTLGGDAVGPLHAGLAADDAGFVARLLLVAARLHDPRLIYFLARPAIDPRTPPDLAAAAQAALAALGPARFDEAEAKTLLSREIRRLFDAALRESADPRPEVDVWVWDAATKTSVGSLVPRAVDFADRAAWLATDLMALEPGDAATQRYGMTVRLTAAKLDLAFDAPLATGPGTAHDAAVAAGMPLVDDVLGAALDDGNWLAAAAAARILGEIGDAELFTEHGASPSPLAAALEAPDRRTRFAALAAAMKLAPELRFPGDSRLAKDLDYFVNTTGTRRVLVGHPRTDIARYLAGLLAAAGYETDVATTGREVFKLATTSPDYEFALLHISLQDSRLDDLLTSLRRDYRSARLPIGLLGLSMDEKLADRLAAGYAPAAAFREPENAAVMRLRAGDLLELLGRYHSPLAERQREAALAAGWIGELAARPDNIRDLAPLVPALIVALQVPDLVKPASAALVHIGTVPGQLALLDMADNSILPIPARTAAARAFRESVALHGILLTKAQLARQYDLYNGSAGADPAVQELLGAVLDILENPKAIAVGEPKPRSALSP